MKRPLTLSNHPGIYIFRNRKNIPLYIGKAGNLKKRLAFYFSSSPKSPRLNKLLEEAKKLEINETDSEIEALIKEAELIKKHSPKYNVLMRDDKNYFYVGFTRETFPRILITHQPNTYQKFQITNYKLQTKSPPSLKLQRASKIQSSKHAINYIGPFTDGNALKTTLRLLRRIFSYCTCKEIHKRPCLNAEIGRCQGFCCTKPTNNRQLTTNNITNYKNDIKNIVAVLGGKKKKLLRELKIKMKEATKEQKFEKAAVLRDQIWGLENIFKHRQILARHTEPPGRHPERSEGSYGIFRSAQNDETEKRLQKLLKTTKSIRRIEGYDISNISGAEATGSMVVFVKKSDGAYVPDKSQYRKFKIKTVHQISDVDMLAEVIKRRFKHHKWSYPDLMVIDGGKPQLHAAHATIANQSRIISRMVSNNDFNISDNSRKNLRLIKEITVTALAKREEELYIAAPLERGEPRPFWGRENRKYPIKLKQQPKEMLHLFQRIRDESHRFAKKYHHKLREMKFLSKF